MPYSKSLSELKKAMAQERPSPELKLACAQFLKTMQDCHLKGTAPPTVEQFIIWRDAVAMQNRTKTHL